MKERTDPNAADLRHVETWLFDLDNTIYPLESGLGVLIERKITDWKTEPSEVAACFTRPAATVLDTAQRMQFDGTASASPIGLSFTISV